MYNETLRSLVAAETKTRRTFAIISHPDAGKTTLTEKLLLYAGMIRTAGMVQGRKTRKYASSDWMAMEQERGISITASAMQFSYKDVVINVLDTPGHQDFSEDTYRTLTAADSAVMVIDAGNGVQAQTIKLFRVCRMRSTPIITFINKLDLPGREPLDLIAEVEGVLGMRAAPLNWPIGRGKDFRGIVDLQSDEIILFEKGATAGTRKALAVRFALASAEVKEHLPVEVLENVKNELELIKHAGNSFSKADFLAGNLTPVFFGSAFTNFGVEPFFDKFAELAPCPGPRLADNEAGEEIIVDALDSPFSAYVFKIQANMDPKHRDSMAFMRVCSGRFERDLTVRHERLKKEIRLSRSHSMFAGDRATLDLAYPGDIVGVVNPGLFAIGDTVSLAGGFNFKPMPKFPPEVVARIRPIDVLRKKAFDKGMQQLSDEGAILILRGRGNYENQSLVAAVGPLQFEVLQYRLKDEYKVETALEPLPFKYGAWLIGNPDGFVTTSTSTLAEDKAGNPILLYTQEWEKRFSLEKNPGYQLAEFI